MEDLSQNKIKKQTKKNILRRSHEDRSMANTENNQFKLK